jgi:hypothetical protein
VRIEKVLPFKAKTKNIIHIRQDLQDEQDILPFLKKGKKYHPPSRETMKIKEGAS